MIVLGSRFWSKVDKNGPWASPRKLGRCWIWTASKVGDGYGSYNTGLRRTNGTKVIRQAHRLSYEAEFGPLPPDIQLDHICRNPSCVRPWHMRPVTATEHAVISNGQRVYVRPTECRKGHVFTPENTSWQCTSKGHLFQGCKKCRAANQRRYLERKRAA